MHNKVPFVDKDKKRVFISLGIPMYNELAKGNLHETIDNAIAVGFDDIVILDDGSTDGSWIVLKQYESIYNNIRVFRSPNNSVFSLGNNRWKFIVEKMAERKPDWIVIRAADQIYSHRATIAGGDHFRKKLTKFYHDGVEAVRMPLIHLWRSRTWYRSDNVWGRDASTHSKMPIWRFDPSYNYSGRERTGAHMGWHHPSYFGYGSGRKLKVSEINAGTRSVWDLVILHLGHTTHNKKVLKFKWSMAAAVANKDSGRTVLMPPPDEMPTVRMWMRFNGYKGFYEFNMALTKAPTIWFATSEIEEAKPVPESMYYTILEYNVERASEYRELYDKFYNKQTKALSPIKPKTRRELSKRIIDMEAGRKAEAELKKAEAESFNQVRKLALRDNKSLSFKNEGEVK